MVIPFLVQIYINNEIVVIVCMSLMGIVVLFLFILEMIQLKNLSWGIYKQDVWNFLELGQYFLFVGYFSLRMTQLDKSVLPGADNMEEVNRI